MRDFKANKSPLSWVPTVYFAMGFPYICLSIVAVVMLKDLGMDNADIAKYTSMLVIPWSLKPLLSPFMELFGSKRLYVILCELISALMLGSIVYSLPLDSGFRFIIALMGVIAISGSMHDIAGDGIYLEQLTADVQSKYSGWQGAFYNMAKVLANGALVFLAGYLTAKCNLSPVHSWQIIMLISALIMLSIAIYHFFFLPKDRKREEEKNIKEKFYDLWNLFKLFFCKKYIVIYIIFIILYRLAEGLAMKIVPLFLKDSLANGGLALSNQEYGLIYGTFGAIAFIVGSIIAGHVVSRYGLKSCLFALALCFNIPFVVYLLFALSQVQSIAWIAFGIVMEYFGYGFGFVGLILFMMQQVAPGKYQMTHYAFANSIMNLAVLLPGYFSGYLSEKIFQTELIAKLGLSNLIPTSLLGYKLFFILVMICTIPALWICLIVPFTYKYENGQRIEIAKK